MKAARQRGGWSLIEMLVYITVFAGLSFGAYRALFETITHSRRLQQNTEAIITAVRAGERWRADVRHAVRPITWNNGSLVIPQRDGEIIYRLAENTLWRTVAGKEAPLLRQVQQSRMAPDQRTHVTAWRWELELLPPTNRPTKIVPLFTFLAVPNPETSR